MPPDSDASMHVVATAGHVDHGKSTLVRALTGMEPDRWAEERRRGMTIDLGYAWTRLPSGADVAFVDVPGHQRFIGNMLAGLGPAPAVLFVVAADEGWSRQSQEHLAAVDALGIDRGLLAITRSDLADPSATLADARARLGRTVLGDVPALPVSAVTGDGVDKLRHALDDLFAVNTHVAPAPMRAWIDRVFTVRGAGTVVTGTLASGSVAVGDSVELRGRVVGVRGIEALGVPREVVRAPARVAVNLRGLSRDDVARGDVLTAPGEWWWSTEVDARLRGPTVARELPGELQLHIGTAALPVRPRPLGDALVRLRLPRPLPVRAGDRGVLRDPGRQAVAAGIEVLDADPPALRRRGAAEAWARVLADAAPVVDAVRELDRRGAMTVDHLRALGATPPSGAREFGGWLVAEATWAQWCQAAPVAVAEWARRHELDPAMPIAALQRALELPSDAVASALAEAGGLAIADGRVRQPDHPITLGTAESAVRALEARLSADPFAAPEARELSELGLSRRALAAAEKAGRLLRLAGDVVVLPAAIDDAVRRLAALPQPFTTSLARQALGTTRRVAIPLLEHLDALGRTERVDGATRRVRSGEPD